jgi:hypothetical protein
VYYVPAVQEGETVYVLVQAPSGHEVDSLPPEAEEVQVNEQTYYFADNTFYQQIQRDGKTKYVVVDPPAGATVPELPEQTAEYEEDGETVYQYDKTYYAKASAEEGGQGYVVQSPPPEEEIASVPADAVTLYVVQSPPPEEEIASVPADAVTFEVDGETYYYVENSLYVDDTKGGYLNAEPPMDGIAQEIPEGATVVQEGGKMYFQFDTVFFEQVTSGSGTTYKVVPPPGASEVAA